MEECRNPHRPSPMGRASRKPRARPCPGVSLAGAQSRSRSDERIGENTDGPGATPMSDRQREVYSRDAERYDLLVSREDHAGNLLPALARIVPLAGRVVVEPGAGTGRLTRLLAPHVRRVVALDRSRPMLEVAAARVRAAGHANVGLTLADNR